MNIENKTNYLKLYDIYYELLTKRQQEIFELHFEEDFSISEIALELNISSAAVSKTIKQVMHKIESFEMILQINKNYEYNINLCKNNNIPEVIQNKIKK